MERKPKILENVVFIYCYVCTTLHFLVSCFLKFYKVSFLRSLVQNEVHFVSAMSFLTLLFYCSSSKLIKDDDDVRIILFIVNFEILNVFRLVRNLCASVLVHFSAIWFLTSRLSRVSFISLDWDAAELMRFFYRQIES